MRRVLANVRRTSTLYLKMKDRLSMSEDFTKSLEFPRFKYSELVKRVHSPFRPWTKSYHGHLPV